MIRKSVFHSAKDNKIAKAATSRTTLLLKKKDPKQEDEGENGFHYSDFDENDVEMNICKLAHYHGILEHLLHLKTSFNNVDGELKKWIQGTFIKNCIPLVVFALVMEHMLQQPMHYPFRVVQDRGFKDLEMVVVNNSLLKSVKE